MRTPLLIALLLVAPSCGDGGPVRSLDTAGPDTAGPEAAVETTREGPAADGAPGTPPETSRTKPAPQPVAWLDPGGTSIVGFGILRLVPPSGVSARFKIHYTEKPHSYSGSGYARVENLQLFVLPGDVFAEQENVYAGGFLAFARTESAPRTGENDASYGDGALELEIEITTDREATFLVAYGPWTALDVGRPPGDDPTFHLAVEAVSLPGEPSGAFEWVESEAGELVTTDWSGRPGVERGLPVTDPLTGRPLYLEVQPMILYDGRLVRGADEEPEGWPEGVPTAAQLEQQAAEFEARGDTALAVDRRERLADLRALVGRRDRRIVMTPNLTEKFRRVPIRWR